MSQLGVQYAWGGGNTQGPTYGIRDGGVADSHGDYRKIGFDCSGLMIYAFAPITTLPHYSGYQYHSGRKVPLSQMRRGDMLFWGTQRIHHVALYLGNGQMIEAPESGKHVRVAPVRYGDILPYAVRMID
jgi:cell wall-associated NlpC family hydrolase